MHCTGKCTYLSVILRKRRLITFTCVVPYRMLRNLTTSGFMLEFKLTAEESDFLHITITNTDKKTVTRNKLKLLRLPDEEIIIPATVFNRVLSMPSTDFQRYIRELSTISDKIKIKSTSNILILSASGTSGETSIEIQPTSAGLHWSHIAKDDDAEDDVVEGVFHSKYLERFARPLDDEVELFIRKNYPLVIRYVLPSAHVQLVIAACQDEDEAGAEAELNSARD